MAKPENPRIELKTAARLWLELDRETRIAAARAVYLHPWEDASLRQDADRGIAATLRFREVTVRKLPADKRIDYLARVVRPDDPLAASLLMALHLTERKELLAAFLDELKIPHKDGLIEHEHDLEPPDPAALAAASGALRERFPAEQVELYLASLLAMDPGVWGGLAGLVR